MTESIDSTTWRLGTSNRVPYKFMGIEGEFGTEDGSITWTGIIESGRLIDFLEYMFPPARRIGNTMYPIGRSLSGLPAMQASRVSFRSQDDGRGADPISFDPSAPNGTYHPLITVDVTFSNQLESGSRAGSNANDPKTFLDISANASATFLHTSTPNSKWVPIKQTLLDNNNEDDSSPGPHMVDPLTGMTITSGEEQQPAEVNRDPEIPATILVPKTQWNLTWPQIDHELFNDVIIHRLRYLIGRVNKSRFSVLFNAEPETLLFASYAYTQQYSWRNGLVNSPPIKLDIQIIEKRVVWKGAIMGHNEFWRPGKGWQRLLIDGTRPAYSAFDFDFLFQV